VQGVPGDLHDSAIAGAIIAMAHDLKLSVVAEGVENERQLDFLREHACDVVQGFLLSRPLPAQQCRILLLDYGKSHALLARVG
jgi:EAL domain-containing protein (putative c-di-GMP-specific phosphodiesterase class I)